MIALLCFFLTLLASLFKSKSRLEAENAALRRQLIVLRRKVRGRVRLTNGDRMFLVMLYRVPIRPERANRRDITVQRRDDADDALRSGPEHAGAFGEMVLAQGVASEN